MTTTQEEGEAPFTFVKSRRHRRPPPAASASDSRSYSNSTGSLNTTPSSSSGSGFSYDTRKPTRGGRGKVSTRNPLNDPNVEDGEEEEERKIKKACQVIDCFVDYLSSAIPSSSASGMGENGKGKAKEEDAVGGRKSYAQLLGQCLIRVWPLSCHVESEEEEEGKQAKEAEGKPVRPRKIVCLGLGSPTTSRSAQVQLALMVVLRSYLLLFSSSSPTSTATVNATDSTLSPPPSNGETSLEKPAKPHKSALNPESNQESKGKIECLAWDPIFTPTDITLLDRYGIRIVPPSPSPASQPPTHNPGKKEELINHHYTSISTPTLLYMPHCDRELYEEILSLNYPSSFSSKPKIVLLSNMLSHYTIFNHNIEETSPTLYRLAKQMRVENLPNWDSGKRSALLPEKARQDARGDKGEGEGEKKALEVIGDFVKWWDKNGLRDLGFHWL